MVAGFKNQIRMRVLEGKELEDYLKQMQEWEAKKAKAIEDAFQREIVTGDDIVNILRTYTSDRDRWELFANLAENDKLSDEAFNKGLVIAWTVGRGTGDFRAIQYFMRCKKELVMNEEELAYYNRLPDKVTLYRGCSMDEYEDEDGDSCFGISWTTSREIAEFFAFRNEQEDTAVYRLIRKILKLCSYLGMNLKLYVLVVMKLLWLQMSLQNYILIIWNEGSRNYIS